MFPTRAVLTRSSWKGPYIVPLPIQPAVMGERMPAIRTKARSCTILPNFVGLTFQIHNGKSYDTLQVTEDMVGHKLGEFASTRKPYIYKFSKNK